jgi:[acyl-carrier-protein] S-malonyltransferase
VNPGPPAANGPTKGVREPVPTAGPEAATAEPAAAPVTGRPSTVPTGGEQLTTAVAAEPAAAAVVGGVSTVPTGGDQLAMAVAADAAAAEPHAAGVCTVPTGGEQLARAVAAEPAAAAVAGGVSTEPTGGDQLADAILGDRLAATVEGEPVWAGEIDAELDRLRGGPQASRLPAAGTQDGRQLRRWVAQRVVLRRLLEAAARGLAPSDDLPFRPDPAFLGAATADVLATSPAARAVYAAVTAGERADEADLLAYYRRNLDRFTRPDRWTVRVARSAPDLDAATPVPVDPATLPPAVRSALTGQPVAIDDQAVPVAAQPGPWAGAHAVLDAVRPGGVRAYDEVRDEIAAVVLDRRRQLAFARWLDARAAAVITLEPGYEHPADPDNPDATHRH